MQLQQLDKGLSLFVTWSVKPEFESKTRSGLSCSVASGFWAAVEILGSGKLSQA